MVRRVMIAALLVAAIAAVWGAANLAANGGAHLTVTQTVSGGTDNISLTGTGFTAGTTVQWNVAACDKAMGHLANCIDYVHSSSLADASGNFSTGVVDSVTCGSKKIVSAFAVIPGTPVSDGSNKNLAC